MSLDTSNKYNLNERTFRLAKTVREFCKLIKITVINLDDVKQVIRSSGSVGANFIEAQENLSQKDFYHRIKICRKESKETHYWLNLMILDDKEKKENFDLKEILAKEALELTKIFGAIINKSVINDKTI